MSSIIFLCSCATSHSPDGGNSDSIWMLEIDLILNMSRVVCSGFPEATPRGGGGCLLMFDPLQWSILNTFIPSVDEVERIKSLQRILLSHPFFLLMCSLVVFVECCTKEYSRRRCVPMNTRLICSRALFPGSW